MLHTPFGMQARPDVLPVSQPHDALLDNLYAHMAISRRPSTNSHGPQRAMRVTKPRSANNSPRPSAALSRRTSALADSYYAPRRQHQVMDCNSFPPRRAMDVPQPQRQPIRPLSWHPTSYLQHAQLQQRQQQQTSCCPCTAPNLCPDSQEFYSTQPQFSPMASYSNDTSPSPSSTFSPLPLLPGSGNTPYMHAADAWHLPPRANPTYPPCSDMLDSFSTLPGAATGQRTQATGALDWETFIMHGFSNTSPPTPESFPRLQHPHTVVSDAAVPLPFQDLGEPQEEGEILVGMGLYDVPDKFDEDPQLNNYRSTVSSLLGSSFRAQEPRGKGLKLEETWEPPKSDDGEEQDKDDDDNTD